MRLELTRDGWLQPWVRLHSDEPAEQQRLERMPQFLTVNPSGYVRPGAQVMAEVRDAEGTVWPALIVQRFGRGRTGAVTVGDLLRLEAQRRPSSAAVAVAHLDRNSIISHRLGNSIRRPQRPCPSLPTTHGRWLVSDVPRRLDVTVKELPEQGTGSVRLTASVRGQDFEVRENADVRFKVTAPDGREFELTGVPADAETGVFEAEISAAQEGACGVQATAILTSGTAPETLTTNSGWASQPLQQELRSVQVRQDWLQELAAKTGGRLISLDDVNDLVQQLPTAAAPLQEIRSWPIWHSWWVFLAAVLLLSIDWTLRRRGGLP
ncbi:MAG UNVERIFIED_CONTAM: hypothetical protein LVR18_09455 [Planctomycetaceae bacterium]